MRETEPSGAEQESIGAEILRAIGYEDRIGQPITLKTGETIPAEKFTDYCGEHVLPYYAIIRKLPSEHPAHELALKTLQEGVDHYMGLGNESTAQHNE